MYFTAYRFPSCAGRETEKQPSAPQQRPIPLLFLAGAKQPAHSKGGAQQSFALPSALQIYYIIKKPRCKAFHFYFMLLFPIHTSPGMPEKGQNGGRTRTGAALPCASVCGGARAAESGRVPRGGCHPSFRFISETTLLSMREICTCDTPITSATSLCVISRK